MYINQENCVHCKRCIPYCPREAIVYENNQMTICLDLCVECGICKRHVHCPKDAIYNVPLTSPRSFRKAFSDPFGKHENTDIGHMGRGTEEVKTNDVTGALHEFDKVTFAAELGRPTIGASFRDVEKVIQAILPYVIEFELNNPVTALITDRSTGNLDPAVLDEEVFSAIIEFSCKLSDAEYCLESFKQVAKEIDTVFSLCMISLVNEDDTLPITDLLNRLEIDIEGASAKTNLGLGKPLYKTKKEY